jgi:hypothetical protein
MVKPERRRPAGACLELSDRVGSLCERCSQKLHHIRFSEANVHQVTYGI